MGISKIILAIKEYQEIKQTTGPSDQYSFPLQQARNQIESEIVDLIDSRIKSHLARERRKSSTVIEKVDPNFSDKEINLLSALNSAPLPPTNIQKWLGEDPLTWMENYTHWYYKRLKPTK